MPNYAAFTFVMKGPNADLKSIKERIGEGICDELAIDGDAIILLSPAHWGRWSESPEELRSFYIKEPTDSVCRLYRNKLSLSGEAKWGPPIEVAERITNLHPKVTVTTYSDVEHEWGEDWVSSRGRSRRTRSWWWDPEEEDPSKEHKDHYSPDEPDPASKWQSIQTAILSKKEINALRKLTCKSKPIPTKVARPPKVRVSTKRWRPVAPKPRRDH
jgi:hypothetical protein